jgi:uncharacterized membrane protein YciS (DUF1049 family)
VEVSTLKIVIAVVVPILVGIVVGSNLSSVMTVVILNQPTVALPIGVWLLIAIGCGLLSSILIQIGLWIDRRRLKRQIRQLQTRLQQSDQDIFTYTSSSEPSQSSTEKQPSTVDQEDGTSNPKKSLFSSYRSKFTAAFPRGDRFTTKSSTQPIVDDDDDWDVQPRSNHQLDWDDEVPIRQQNSPRQSDEIYADRRSQPIDNQSVPARSEVYDADFRLIQPPYKQPTETEFDDDLDSGGFEDIEVDEVDRDEDFDSASDSVKPTSAQPFRSSTDLDDEDWGFDFDRRDAPIGRN